MIHDVLCAIVIWRLAQSLCFRNYGMGNGYHCIGILGNKFGLPPPPIFFDPLQKYDFLLSIIKAKNYLEHQIDLKTAKKIKN